MKMSEKVAIVTGSNKGLGLEIVRALCRKVEGVVYLTARNESLGNAAVAELEKVKLMWETIHFYLQC
jgi:NAD(P)-dependent dehydrogenase (short-subunit alcohol dehydrogenase family)